MRGERLTGKRVGLVEELRACVQVSEGSDAQTVGGMKLRLKELATDLTHVHQLEEAGCWQQDLRLQHTHTLTDLYTVLYFLGSTCFKITS